MNHAKHLKDIKFLLRLGEHEFQFFNSKKDEHDEDVEETEEELEEDIEDAVIADKKKERSEKKGDDTPKWMKQLVSEIKEAVNPTQTETKAPEAIPVPKAPPVKKEEEPVIPTESKLNKFLKSLW
jgi:hypothetical protein